MITSVDVHFSHKVSVIKADTTFFKGVGATECIIIKIRVKYLQFQIRQFPLHHTCYRSTAYYYTNKKKQIKG